MSVNRSRADDNQVSKAELAADEPAPLSEDAFDKMLDRLAGGADDPVIRAKVLASKDVGYILTEDTLHLFSAHEIDQWEAALDLQ